MLVIENHNFEQKESMYIEFRQVYNVKQQTKDLQQCYINKSNKDLKTKQRENTDVTKVSFTKHPLLLIVHIF